MDKYGLIGYPLGHSFSIGYFNEKFQNEGIDAVYENFVRQIAGDKLKTEAAGESLRESVARDEQRQVLQKQIATLQAKIRKEKQLNKQMQMNNELKKLKKELEAM